MIILKTVALDPKYIATVGLMNRSVPSKIFVNKATGGRETTETKAVLSLEITLILGDQTKSISLRDNTDHETINMYLTVIRGMETYYGNKFTLPSVSTIKQWLKEGESQAPEITTIGTTPSMYRNRAELQQATELQNDRGQKESKL